MASNPTYRGGHRRAQSEVAYHLPDDIDVGADDFQLRMSTDEMGENSIDEDPNESSCMNTEESSEIGTGRGASFHSRSLSVDDDVLLGTQNKSGSAHANTNAERMGGVDARSEKGQTRHRHSNSMDGSSSSHSDPVFSEVQELKKAMAADKLAELAALDPKRAKRILANRQSAARSKERKLRYISDLERKVQTLQAEATTLSAQLALYQRDMAGLNAENKQLKLQLQTMEQQAQLVDALNETMREEIYWLRIATGQLAPSIENSFTSELQQALLDRTFMPFPEQSHQLTMPQLQQLQLSSVMKDEQLGQFHPHADSIKVSSSATLHGVGS